MHCLYARRAIWIGWGALLGAACQAGGSSSDASTTSAETNGTIGTLGTTGGGTNGSTGSSGSSVSSSTGGAAAISTGGTSAANSSTSSNSATTGDATTGAALGALDVSDLMIEPNPNMTISAFVSWSTPEPANSEVQFGEGGYQFRIVDDEATTEHRVLVIGMHASTAYQVKAVSTNATASGSAEGTFTTGELPAAVPVPTLSASNPQRSQSGWTLTNAQVGRTGGGFGSNEPAVVVMYDEAAIPVWYYLHGETVDSRGDISTMLLPNGNVLVGPGNQEPAREVTLAGDVVWEGPAQPSGMAQEGGRTSHHAGKLANGNYVLIREDPGGGNSVEEITPENEVVWSWTLLDHVTKPANAQSDWCHGNSATIDEAGDFFYLNCRYQGFFKGRRSTGELLWHMGAAIDDPESGDVTFVPAESRFNDSHDPELHDDGSIIFYDNDGYEQRSGSNGSYHSRVVEYQVDQTAKQATLSWEFPGNFAVDDWYKSEWYTPFWGDADRLANGNVLICAGVLGAGKATRLFEVTKDDGEVVWELTMPDNVGSYRAERLSPPPLVERLP